ncbi:alpha/beta fold hydrolase [Kribbella capetownensis]|uniref:alpha/beta fold hydrolase n=1 Tax=Kribbella capetownensis TaxID=1572659 RepID=UPI00192D6DF1|nr:alpha/beta hydrolase [Kribbella capetownensis]
MTDRTSGTAYSVFDGFTTFDVPVSGATIHGRRGGDGPPVLLLHGFPETHVMWHRVAPALAREFSVVATDLTGFGDSTAGDTHSMRELATHQVEVMQAFGYDAFAVAGHDRGARCAYRMALDHPDVVTRLAVLDIVPTGDAFDRADKEFALGYWVWSFLAAPEPIPERLIAQEPELFVQHCLDSWSAADVFPREVRNEYVRHFRDPATVHAICEEYRAAATVDHQHDTADRGVRRIGCPVLALWDPSGAVVSWYGDPIAIWREWADEVVGAPIPAGHFMAEEAPAETLDRLMPFLRGDVRSAR